EVFAGREPVERRDREPGNGRIERYRLTGFQGRDIDPEVGLARAGRPSLAPRLGLVGPRDEDEGATAYRPGVGDRGIGQSDGLGGDGSGSGEQTSHRDESESSRDHAPIISCFRYAPNYSTIRDVLRDEYWSPILGSEQCPGMAGSGPLNSRQ